jgi:hypothetical protein
VVNADDNANKDWSFSRGQYIPTTAVDQVASTLARWMGVTDSGALAAIFPSRTYEYSPEPKGSTNTTSSFGFFALRADDTPPSVPPVPHEATSTSMRPSHCAQISSAVVSA